MRANPRHSHQSLSEMVRCPLCAKKFKSRMAVLAHINQPLGSCMPYIAELAATQLPSNESPTQCWVASATEEQDYEPEIGPSWPDEEDSTMDVDSLTAHQCEPNYASGVDEFQGARQTFGKGKTFLDDFNTDPYAAERHANLYYPFASKDEWELASFLLLSGLSMASITKFLSLRLVCSFYFSSVTHRFNVEWLGAGTSPLVSDCEGPPLTG